MRCRCKKVMIRPIRPQSVFRVGEWYDYYPTGVFYSVEDPRDAINESEWNISEKIFIAHFDTEVEVRDIEIDKILNG
jgi:hypothetical protein